jgi:hypothetical protein
LQPTIVSEKPQISWIPHKTSKNGRPTFMWHISSTSSPKSQSSNSPKTSATQPQVSRGVSILKTPATSSTATSSTATSSTVTSSMAEVKDQNLLLKRIQPLLPYCTVLRKVSGTKKKVFYL